MVSRCRFITSSYWRRCLRVSKLRASTDFCAAAELVVDAARLVALGADDVQAAEVDDLFVLLLDERLDVGERLLELLRRRLLGVVGVDLLPLEVLAREELGVAAQQDVRAAAGHVGRNR